MVATIDAPTVYIGAENWIAYQRHKAKQFATEAEAHEHLLGLNLAACWQIISYETEEKK